MTRSEPARRSVRTNAAWMLIANGVFLACQGGILIALARLGTVEMVGRYTLGLAVAAPVFFLSNLTLRDLASTDVSQRFAMRDYVRLRMMLTPAAVLVIVLIAFAGYPAATGTVVILVGLTKASDSVSDVYYGDLQRAERLDLVARSMILRGVLALAVTAATLALTGDLRWAIAGHALAWLAFAVSHDRRCAHALAATAPHDPAPVRASRLISLFVLALPLGVTAVLTSLRTATPRFVIERALGERELGIFGALAFLATSVSVLASAVGQAAAPRLARYYMERRVDGYRRLTAKMIAVAVALGGVAVAVALLAGSLLLRLLYGPDYASFDDLLVLLMIGAVLANVASVLNYSLTAMRRLRIQVWLLGLTLVVAVTSAMILVPENGLRGAAWTTLLTLGTHAVASLIVNAVALARDARAWRAAQPR